jgi:CheY-like chemotaxis protein
MSENPSEQQTVILLVDDEEFIRSLLRSVLSGVGYQVLDAPNGQDALHQSRAHGGPIHLLLTDVHMPVMDGLSLVKAITEERPDTRILLMTGYASSGIPPALLPRLIPKPFSTTELLTWVELELSYG